MAPLDPGNLAFGAELHRAGDALQTTSSAIYHLPISLSALFHPLKFDQLDSRSHNFAFTVYYSLHN
jgi:hypothetical protein